MSTTSDSTTQGQTENLRKNSDSDSIMDIQSIPTQTPEQEEEDQYFNLSAREEDLCNLSTSIDDSRGQNRAKKPDEEKRNLTLNKDTEVQNSISDDNKKDTDKSEEENKKDRKLTEDCIRETCHRNISRVRELDGPESKGAHIRYFLHETCLKEHHDKTTHKNFNMQILATNLHLAFLTRWEMELINQVADSYFSQVDSDGQYPKHEW